MPTAASVSLQTLRARDRNSPQRIALPRQPAIFQMQERVRPCHGPAIKSESQWPYLWFHKNLDYSVDEFKLLRRAGSKEGINTLPDVSGILLAFKKSRRFGGSPNPLAIATTRLRLTRIRQTGS
jgi:hypothetical protein